LREKFYLTIKECEWNIYIAGIVMKPGIREENLIFEAPDLLKVSRFTRECDPLKTETPLN
jgi:hypothetical protein